MEANTVFTLSLAKEDMKFSAAHFTIFSKSERERLHGHNYQIEVEIQAFASNGLTFDYNIIKQKVRSLCKELDEFLLLPGHSPYLTLIEQETTITLQFNEEQMLLPKRDIKVLPVANITGEALAQWFLEHLTETEDDSLKKAIKSISLSIYSGKGQSITLRRDMS